MRIGLLFAQADQQSDVENHLRSLGHSDFLHPENFAEPPPWPDSIILADWTILRRDQRLSLLQTAQNSPCMALIIFAPILSGDDARQMLHGGVADILNRLSDLNAIGDAVGHQIQLLEHKRIWLQQQRSAAAILQVLTPREQDILRALSGGASNKAAARLLNISPRTVEVHRANMLRRTGMASIADLLKTQQSLDEAKAALHPGPSLIHSEHQPCRRDLAPPYDQRSGEPARTSESLPCGLGPTPLQPDHRRLLYISAADRLASERILS